MNEEETELFPEDDDADLAPPPGATEHDELGCALALALRQARRAAEELLHSGERPGPELREQIAAHIPLCDSLLEEFGPGVNEADRLDQVAAEERAASERHLREVRDSLVYAGSDKIPQTYSVFGWRDDGRPAAFGHDGGHIVVSVGIPNSGKSSASYTQVESAQGPCPGLNSPLHRDTAAFLFHADLSGQDRLPDILAGLRPSGRQEDLELLAARLGARAQGIRRMNLVLPAWLLDDYRERLRPYEELGLRVFPLRARLPELPQSALEVLVGAEGDAHYVQQMMEEAQELGERLTIERWHQIIEDSAELNAAMKRLAHRRLRLLDRIAARNDSHESLWDPVGPGVLTVYSLGGRRIGTRDALPLIVGLLHGLSQRCAHLGPFQRLFLLDEINQYDRDPLVYQHLLMAARQVRHRGSTLWISGQDLLGVPDELLALSTVLAVFRLRGPKVWEHVRERVHGLRGWRFEDIAALGTGEAVVAVAESTDPAWRQAAQWVYFRPLCCEHGGHTKAVM